jgi:hypothetical protein
MQFSPSPLGHHLLAYNSSRIYVLDVQGPEIAVKRELKILRRPAATCITDDGTVLAVLLTDMQIDLYDLKASPPRRSQSIILDNSPRAIALSPCATVIAAAYEGGIEVTSVHSSALATDRRAVKCDAVDALAFSFDGTQILGTTVYSAQPNTVILTAPYYDPGSHIADESMSALWTTSILFPNTSRDCSHAVLLQNSSREEASWTFTYDRSFETFRAVRIDDLRNGTTYFTGPLSTTASQARLLPCTLPAASYYGELVSAGFQGKDIWLYGVPEDLDAIPETATTSSDGSQASSRLMRSNSGPSIRSQSRMQEAPPDARVPQWQVLCDNPRNKFNAGSKVAELCGVTNVKWVEGFGGSMLRERLVVAARGVLPPKPITEEDGIDFIDGGRLILVDFDYGLDDGSTTEVTIEVGTDNAEVLEEETRDMETEVAIVRRRTVAQRRGNAPAMRSATSAGRPPPMPSTIPPLPTEAELEDPLRPRARGDVKQPLEEPTPGDDVETQSIIEEQEALDAPYSHGMPRSGTTLRRAATAAAINRRMQAPPSAAGNAQLRRADGRREHPHESDADNWVPPPPPYQKDDPQDLPVFLRHNVPPVIPADEAQPAQTLRIPTEEPAAAPWTAQPQQGRSQTTLPSVTRPSVPATGLPPTHQRNPSDLSAGRPVTSSSLRPPSRVSVTPSDEEGLYDVSPPASPRLAEGRLPPVAAREPSSSSAWTAASGHSSVAPQTQAATTSVNAQPSLTTIPSIQTIPSSPSSRGPGVPALELQIPSPNFATETSWNTAQSSAGSPAVLKPTHSQTWPKPPPAQGAPAVLPAGYPYSAPPTDVSTSQRMEQSYPPAPRPEQLASLQRHGGQTQSVAQRQSGQFQLARVPVGSRDSRRLSGNKPLPSLPPNPLQQHPPDAVPLHHPQPQRGPPPVEDQPLIISTPKGVTGAFDPPGRNPSTHRAETPILAPVPRHPRQNETASVLGRPPAERLDTIWSMGPPGQPGAQQPYLTAPSQSTRQSSLNRKQSRAERSAAKNIADAKKNGWRRSKSKSRRNNIRKKDKPKKDFDAASSAAWTDVTASSAGYLHQQQQMPPLHYQQQQGGPQGKAPGQKGKGGKCVVM